MHKKSVSGLKQKKWTPYWIVHIRISVGTKLQFWFTNNFDFWTKFAQKECFQSKTEKVNTTTIGIFLDTKFQLKLAILILWTKLVQKGSFRSKTEKVNTNIEFYIFELVYITNLSLNWVGLGPNLPLKETTLNFWTNFVQKRLSSH